MLLVQAVLGYSPRLERKRTRLKKREPDTHLGTIKTVRMSALVALAVLTGLGAVLLAILGCRSRPPVDDRAGRREEHWYWQRPDKKGPL